MRLCILISMPVLLLSLDWSVARDDRYTMLLSLFVAFGWKLMKAYERSRPWEPIMLYRQGKQFPLAQRGIPLRGDWDDSR